VLFQIAPNLSNPVNNFADCVEDAVEFVRNAAVWRHEVDRIAERPDQQPATKEITVEARPDTGQIAIVIRGDIKCGDGSDLTDVAKARILTKAIETLGLRMDDGRDALDHRFVLPNLQVGTSGRAGDRVRSVGAGMEEGLAAIR
jgi:hypothetical protein